MPSRFQAGWLLSSGGAEQILPLPFWQMNRKFFFYWLPQKAGMGQVTHPGNRIRETVLPRRRREAKSSLDHLQFGANMSLFLGQYMSQWRDISGLFCEVFIDFTAVFKAAFRKVNVFVYSGTTKSPTEWRLLIFGHQPAPCQLSQDSSL